MEHGEGHGMTIIRTFTVLEPSGERRKRMRDQLERLADACDLLVGFPRRRGHVVVKVSGRPEMVERFARMLNPWGPV